MAEEKWLVDGPKVIDVEGIRRLKVSLVRGQVNIVGHDEPGARIEVHSVRGKPIKVSVDGDQLIVDHPQLSWDNFLDVFTSFRGSATVDVSIMVPRATALNFGVVSAGGLISGLRKDAKISTVSGDLIVDDIEGDVELNSVSGEIAVRDHLGRITSHTVSGDLTASGDIRKLTADSVSGSVFLDLAGTPDQVRINTVSGTVTARLEKDVAVQYTIATVGGRIQLDNSQVTATRGNFTGQFGELDKHWLEFRANSVGGDISVLHAVSA